MLKELIKEDDEYYWSMRSRNEKEKKIRAIWHGIKKSRAYGGRPGTLVSLSFHTLIISNYKLLQIK